MAPLVVLVGVPGAGKSTVAALRAAELGEVWESDEVLAAMVGASAADHLLDQGEAVFRESESRAVAAALAEDGGVVVLGGGAVTDPGVRAALTGIPVVWLRVTAATAAARSGLNAPRPLALGNVRTQFAALVQQHDRLYADLADIVIDTDRSEPDRVAEQILAELGRREEGAP